MTGKAPAVIEGFFAAMQAGATKEDALIGLFAADAIYVEPFTRRDQQTTHSGREAVRAAFRGAWQNPLPDQRIQLDRVDVTGNDVRVEWTCFSVALPGGQGRGVNTFALRDGKIVRLETTFLLPGAP